MISISEGSRDDKINRLENVTWRKKNALFNELLNDNMPNNENNDDTSGPIITQPFKNESIIIIILMMVLLILVVMLLEVLEIIVMVK